jgi:hypothetical protein
MPGVIVDDTATRLPAALTIYCLATSTRTAPHNIDFNKPLLLEKMGLFSEEDAPLLKAWVVKKLENTYVFKNPFIRQ